MRFSWRVMVRAKGGSTTFVVHDRSNGRTFHVSPRQYLTDLQESEMSSQPDLILQLAHHIARDLQARGHGPLEVRADSRASLNGRPSIRLIDPSVDLTQIADGFARADWILPGPTSAPPHTRLVP
jgi:vitamin K-dependent gamma-carboxylase